MVLLRQTVQIKWRVRWSAASRLLLVFFRLAEGGGRPSFLVFLGSSSGSTLHLGFDLSGQGGEGLLNIDCIFSRSLQKLNSKWIGQGLSFFCFDLPVGLEVWFVSYQQFYHILVAVLIHFGQPVFDIFEGLSIGDVVDQDYPVSSFVVGGSYCFEPFLPGSVPDLQFNGAASGLEGSDFEVDSDGGEEAA